MWNAVSPHSCGSSPHIVATVMSTGWRLTDIWSHLCILSKRRTNPVTIYPVEEKPGTSTSAFTGHSGKSTWTLIMSTTLNAVGEASSLHASQTGHEWIRALCRMSLKRLRRRYFIKRCRCFNIFYCQRCTHILELYFTSTITFLLYLICYSHYLSNNESLIIINQFLISRKCKLTRCSSTRIISFDKVII